VGTLRGSDNILRCVLISTCRLRYPRVPGRRHGLLRREATGSAEPAWPLIRLDASHTYLASRCYSAIDARSGFLMALFVNITVVWRCAAVYSGMYFFLNSGL
jgi:hypothetical protein